VASSKPLREHLDDFEQSLRDTGATSEYKCESKAMP